MARPFIVKSSVGTIEVYLHKSMAMIVPVDEVGLAVTETPGTVERPSDLAELLANVAEIPMSEADELTAKLVGMARERGKRWRWLTAT